MTDTRWNHINRLRNRDITCHYEDGEKCTAWLFGKCIGLSDTTLTEEGLCKFFRDKTKMTEEEIEEYEKAASFK